MRSPLPFTLFWLLFDAHSVNAVTFPFRVRTRTERSGSLKSRANNDTILPVHNTQNSEYVTNITLGGRNIPVLLDTGRYDYVRTVFHVTRLTPQEARICGSPAMSLKRLILECLPHCLMLSEMLKVCS